MTKTQLVDWGFLLAVLGGIAFVLGALVAGSMDTMDVYEHAAMYDTLKTVSNAGILFIILGVVLIVLGNILESDMKPISPTAQTQYQYPGANTPKLCVYCAYRLYGALRCPRCGKDQPTWDQAKRAWVFESQTPDQTEPTDQRTFCPHCGKPYQGTPFCAYCGKKV